VQPKAGPRRATLPGVDFAGGEPAAPARVFPAAPPGSTRAPIVGRPRSRRSPPPAARLSPGATWDAIQKIALDWPAYGSRRITHELKAPGWEVNRKRVQRIQREDNLLCVAKRKFVVTTDSAHGRKVSGGNIVVETYRKVFRANLVLTSHRKRLPLVATSARTPDVFSNTCRALLLLAVVRGRFEPRRLFVLRQKYRGFLCGHSA
jgi:HTH-like domain